MTRPCTGCGLELTAHPGVTEDACLDAVLARLKATLASRPPALERAPQRDLVTEIVARGQARIAALEASPFACGACGEKLLSADADCFVCQRLERERREHRDLDQRRMSFARIPPRYAWATFDAPELAARVRDRRAVLAARALTVGRTDRIVLVGNAGSGKTSLACCILRTLMARGVASRFVTAGDLAVARRHAALGLEAPEVDRALDAEVLLIDDLGENDPITAHSAVGHVIHTRHARELATVITTARTSDELDAKYGSGITRRMFEGAKRVEVALRP